ncbi:unnamed protein product [Trifolium pratense]|uniref:Uncharacterized protein n=1 Tax=Trifolium pratense TaxID=57577 RepID=A0ACB0LKN5_TRIPR|nr:unnamed protein product [Trifolium pratense]
MSLLPKASQHALKISSGGVRIIRTLVLLLRLHTLVTHLFASLNHPLLALGFLILVRLIMHVTGNTSLFSSLSTFGFLPNITSANGSQIQSQGIGTVQILPSLSVDSVLYVPGFPFNLLSNSRLIRSHDCIVTFTKSNVTLQDRSSGRTIGVGCESQGLYYLSLTSNTCSAIDSPLTIHAQLGHPGLSKHQKLVPSLSKLSDLHCESCQLGKHTRSHFADRVNKRASSPFSLVHSNVWGSSRTMSTLESKYFVTFIDDFSRCTWIFLMKNRSELFSIF